MSVHQIRPCPVCARDTRPSHVQLAKVPNTIVRRRGGMCDLCWRAAPPPHSPVQERELAYTRQGLESFLRRRRDRENAMFRRELIATYPHLLKESA